MNTLKEDIQLFLCPNISPIKIKNRCTLRKQQLSATVKGNAVVDIPKYFSFFCEVCNTSDSSNTMINDNEGIEVCLWGDRKGCGNVLYMNRFTQLYVSTYYEVAEDLFSVQSHFVSQYKDGCKNSNV